MPTTFTGGTLRQDCQGSRQESRRDYAPPTLRRGTLLATIAANGSLVTDDG